MNTKNDCFSIVIETHDYLNNLSISKEVLQNYLDSQDNIIFYAFILHDSDENTPHYHIVIKLHNALSKTTIINDFAKFLNCNKTIIQVQTTYDLVLSVQYLCHKNDNNKFAYDFNLIQTNDIVTLDTLFKGANCFKLNIDYLRYVCISANRLTDVFSTLGIETSKRYYQIIKIVWEEVAVSRCQRQECEECSNA